MFSSRVPVGLVRGIFLVRVAFCVALCAALSPIIAEGAPPADTMSPQDEEEPMIRETPIRFDNSKSPNAVPRGSLPATTSARSIPSIGSSTTVKTKLSRCPE